jgi:hypothetical protein
MFAADAISDEIQLLANNRTDRCIGRVDLGIHWRKSIQLQKTNVIL